MRRYETIFIVDNDLTEEGRKQRFEKVKELLSQYGGAPIKFDEWGLKKLAYEINSKNRGYYVYFDYCSEPDFVKEMERSFRLDDKVLKFMTVLLNSDTTPEAVLAEAEKAEAEKIKATEETAKAAEAKTETAKAKEEE
ncbi:MAG: 30S ribosomal protein S6 [Deltaproteobacteria bacterium]|nr:30S ribosomal protein S6 [Deltaproteobacteria bacterium]